MYAPERQAGARGAWAGGRRGQADWRPSHARMLLPCPRSVAYGKIEVYEGGMCEVDLFVQDAEGTRITDECVPGGGAGGGGRGDGRDCGRRAGRVAATRLQVAPCPPAHLLAAPAGMHWRS